MDVFQAFPNAIERWQIAKMAYSTMTGNQVGESAYIDVIVDEGNSANQNRGTTAADNDSDTLLYARPNQLPTIDTTELVASYAITDPNGKTYAIIDAGVGKNQEAGAIEHVELRIRQTGTSA